MRNAFAEALEARTLLSLPSGFQQTLITRVPTEVATSMTFAPDGRLFVADNRRGDVRIVKNGKLLSTPFAHVAVDTFRERGLEAVALDPDFAHNGFVYVYYVHADPSNPNTAPNGAKEYLSRFKASTTNPDISDSKFGEQVLLKGIDATTGYHNGGFLHFGNDGMLYLAIGESGVPANAQDLSTLNGKMLRLDVKNYPNLIPSDNPFVNKSGARGEIYALGLRNPFTGDIDPVSGKIFENDVGQGTWEEINQITAGGNYGWPTAEGPQHKTGLIDPFYAYNHNGGNAAITGGTFYEGNQFPASYKGKYFFADEVNRFIRVLDPATKTATDFEPNSPQALDLDVGPDGSLYVLEIGGNIYKISYVGTGNRAPTAVETTDVNNGPLPLTVDFDGSGSSDPDNDPLTYSWNFGDGTTGTGQNVAHEYDTAGTYNATLTVTDGHGGTDTTVPLAIFAGNSAPIPTISLPAIGATYAAGDAIQFAGDATDPDDGALPDSAFHWSIVFHHEMHTHPFIDAIDGVRSGSFVIPNTGEVDPVQWYRVHLTVTDSGGLSTDVFTDVNPLTSKFTLASNVTGIQLTLDGAPQSAPTTTTGVVGMQRAIGAPQTVSLNGKSYQFTGWSDGGAATHNILTPGKNTTFTATYKTIAGVGTTLSAVADAYVHSGSTASKNFGKDVTLQVKKSSTGYARETYLKFDLSSISKINSAKLRLFGSLSDVTASNIVTQVFGASNTSWSETGITYKNRPATSGSAIASAAVKNAIGAWYEFDVTKYLKAQKAAGKKLVTLVLKNLTSATPFTVFNSREAKTNRPQMVIT